MNVRQRTKLIFKNSRQFKDKSIIQLIKIQIFQFPLLFINKNSIDFSLIKGKLKIIKLILNKFIVSDSCFKNHQIISKLSLKTDKTIWLLNKLADPFM